MRLERVLFPDNGESSWGKENSKSSSSRDCLGDRRGGKTKVRRGKKKQQKHRVGKKEQSISVPMNPYANKSTKRKKKISRSSNRAPVPQTDPQNDTMETTQSSLALNDTKSSASFVSKPALHALGTTDSLMFLGSMNENVRSKIENSMSGGKSEQRRNKRGRVSKRARDFVTKLAQGNDGSLIDNRATVSRSGKIENTKEAPNNENGLKEKQNGKSSRQQPQSRRPKRQRDCNENTSRLHDSRATHQKSGGEAYKEKLDDADADMTTKPNNKRAVKFATQQSEGRRGKRSKGKLHVSSGGLNSLCGLDNHGFSFPVPDPVLNRSVLVSPLSIESFDSSVNKDGGQKCKRAKKSTKSRSYRTTSESKNGGVRDGKNAEKAIHCSVESACHKPSSKTETRKAEILSKKQCESTESNQITPKRSHEQIESEPESVCASFSNESAGSLSKQHSSRQLPHASSTQNENMSIHGSALKSFHEAAKEIPLAKASLSTKSRVTNSSRLLSLSQPLYLDSPSNTSLKREALKRGAGAYVLDVEEADLSKSLSSSLEQRHRVIDGPKVNKDSNCDRQVSTLKEEPLEVSNDKENIEKKPFRKTKSAMEETNDKKGARQDRRFGRSVDGNVKHSEQPKTQQQKSGGLAKKEVIAAIEPTPLRRSTRARRSSMSNDDKENSETKSTGTRRSRRSVGRPRRLGVYEGDDDDSAYVPTPSARNTSKKSKKGLSSKTPAKKPVPKTTESEEDKAGTGEAEINTNEWNEEDVLLLREAQKEVDPKSYSYWQDVADLVGARTAEECQEKWFSLAKTPNIRRRKKKDKENPKEVPITPQDDDQDDDIFDATPMKALFSTSFDDEDPLMGSMEFLSKLNLGSAVKVDRVPVEHESNTLATKRGYKSYIRGMKREVHAKDKSKKPRLPQAGKSKVKNLKEHAEEGDIELKGRLSPGGTFHITSNVDEDIDDGYDTDEEIDDVGPLLSRIQAR